MYIYGHALGVVSVYGVLRLLLVVFVAQNIPVMDFGGDPTVPSHASLANTSCYCLVKVTQHETEVG